MICKRKALKILLSCVVALAPVCLNAAVYYVSPGGNNSNGTSWATAWSELGNINWTVLQPGDTIYLDGGTTQMEYYPSYEKPFKINKSGTQGNPISIRLSKETGRNGKVIIYGDRPIPLPYNGQSESSYSYTRPRPTYQKLWGINFSGASHIVVDGTKWRGITITRTDGGIVFDAHYITVRNMEVYDTGFAVGSGTLNPSSDPGALHGGGDHVTVERLIVHDNGEDGFRPWNLCYLTIRQSWFYNARPHPTATGRVFNYVNHRDGCQFYRQDSDPQIHDYVFEDDIYGPGLMQGLLDRTGTQPDRKGASNVTVRNCLFYGTDGADGGTSVFFRDGTGGYENITIDHVTAYRPVTAGSNYAIYNNASGASTRSLTNNICYGNMGCESNPTNFTVSGFYVWPSVAWPNFGSLQGYVVANPLFVDENNGNFALQSNSPCKRTGGVQDIGSRVTSTAKFFELFPDEGAGSAAGTVQFTASSINISENAGSAVLTVSRIGGSNGAVSVQYATSNGTATSGSDYTAKNGTLNWPNGDSADKTFTIGIINDTAIENSETVNLILNNAAGGAALGIPVTAVLTILNDDVVSTDSTPPSKIANIRDGLQAADIGSTALNTQLSANWDASVDFESGVVKYWYAIGTTQGGTDIADWADNGSALSATRTGLSLRAGVKYYFSVKAENGVGLEGTPAFSDGQEYAGNIADPEPVKDKIKVKHQNLCRLSNLSSLKFQLSGIEGSSEMKIYTITGKLVKTIDVNSGAVQADWDLLNQAGGMIKPGIYLYTIADNSGKRTSQVIINFPIFFQIIGIPLPYRVIGLLSYLVIELKRQ